MAGKLVQLFPGATPVWDIAGDGSQGYCDAVAVIAGGGGGGSGTVTSIDPADATLTFTPNPITGVGTIGINLANPNTWSGPQTFVAPVLGAATATSINKVTITQPTTGATLTIADGKTLTVSNNATVSGTNTGDQTNISGNAATVTTNANLTGPIASAGNTTSITAQTGTGTTFVMSAAPAIIGGSHTALTGLGIRSTGAAFDLTIASTEVFTAGRTLTIVLGDAARTLTLSGNVTLTSTPAVLTANSFTAAQTVTVTDVATNTVTNCLTLSHDTSGTATTSFGTGLLFNAQDSTTPDQNVGSIQAGWATATHASRTSQMNFQIVTNASALSIGFAIGSRISGGSAYLLVGGIDAFSGAIWSSGVATPSSSNCALSSSGTITSISGTTTVNVGINGSAIATFTSSTIQLIQPITKYNNVSTAGLGVPAIYGSANITAQSAAATITSYANPATDADYEVCATANVTVATSISTSLAVTYTDVNNVPQTLIFPIQLAGGTGGTYLTNGLIIATGDYSTPVHKIRVKASTTITIKTSTGTFTGVTYSASGTIKQTA